MKFEEQSFVIVGAAKAESIGLNFVKQLLNNGVKKIAVFDVVDPSDTINQLKVQFSDRTILFNKVDVRNKAEIESAFKIAVDAFGTVDVLANIAGICNESKVEDMLHLGTIYTTMIGVEHMSVEKGGRGGMIVNVASLIGLEPFYRCPVYSASKSGVIGFTRALADKELAPNFGIKFVIICPGVTLTDMIRSGISNMYGTYDVDEQANQIEATFGSQTAEECAKSLIQALKESENGSTWILDKAKYTAVKYHQYFNPN